MTSVPEIVSFITDFGVKFGTFICFDILFREPAIQLTRVHQVTDIVYSTAWFSEVPFLTGKQNVIKSFLSFHQNMYTNIINYSSCTNTSRMVIC